MSYTYLTIAILTEVIATTALKASENFTRLIPSLIVIFGYAVAFYCMTLVIRTIPVGITYAIWSGAGIVLITLLSALLYQQIPDWPAVFGMTLIVSGVVVIHLFSDMAVH